jgi:hypothetical protein
MSLDAHSLDDEEETMTRPTVETPPKIPCTIRSARSMGRLETNPINRIIMPWETSPLIKSIFGLNREVRDPQKVDTKEATKLGAAMMTPNQIRVS